MTAKEKLSSLCYIKYHSQAVMVHAFNSSTEMQKQVNLYVQGQPAYRASSKAARATRYTEKKSVLKRKKKLKKKSGFTSKDTDYKVSILRAGDGSVVKRLYCSFRGPEFGSQYHGRWLTTTCNFGSRGPDALF